MSFSAPTNTARGEGWLAGLLSYFEAEALDEVLVNGVHSLVLVAGTVTPILLPSPFKELGELLFQVQDFALSRGLRLDPLSPAAGGKLEDSSFRWHCVIPPLAPEGPLFALRRHRFGGLQLSDFSSDAAKLEDLLALFHAGSPLLFCGPTASGKTSLLHALLEQNAALERVLIVEEFAELPLAGAAWIRLLARSPGVNGKGGFSFAFLLQESLRLRPDRLVLGELRGENSVEFFEAIASGHRGCCATMHGSNLSQIRLRLEKTLKNHSLCWSSLANQGVHCIFLQRGPLRPQIESICALGGGF